VDLIDTVKNQLKAHRKAGLIGAAITVLAGFLLLKLQIFGVPAGGSLINLSYDLPFNARNNIWADQAVIVYLDEPSETELHQPSEAPWDRALHVQLLERLKEDGAKGVVFDVLFTDPGPPAADQKFAEAMRSCGKVILGAELVRIGGDATGLNERRHAGHKLSLPIDMFLNSAASIGLVMHIVDGDRAVRQHFQGFSLEDEPGLSWEAARLAGAEVTQKPEQRLTPRWFNYYGPPGTIPNVSYYQAILGGLSPGFFRDKVVFIGSKQTAGFTGTSLDVFKSPYARGSLTGNLSFPGVEVHATAFLNLVRQDWLTRLSEPAELAIMVVAGIVFGYGLTLFRPLTAIGAALAGMAAVCLSAFLLFSLGQIWFAWLIVTAAQIPLALLYSVVSNWLELYVQKRLLEHSLELHLPPKRIKELARRPELLKPGAEKQMLSIMFTDIANFTTFSEGMDSNDLARAMNEYFGTTIPCVHEAEGWVVKLIGDSIFALWNAPNQQSNHRELACRAAIHLRDQVLHFSGDESGIKLKTRIGLHTGLANVGNFGSATRIDYTALGESINLASRMEGLNKHLGTDILITRETREGASETITTRFAGHFRLKGFDKAVEVYELIGLRNEAEPTRPWRATFEQALRDFSQRDFDGAERGFRCTLEMRPGDGPAQFYLRQMAELRVHAPAIGWSGEIALKEK